ncbi:MBOAT family O-acyltransferase [Maribacter sp. MJ134]|uniref:MBOAT family O-acyltransferase n=1 Tax=Maribacter sp. MJ134 TaxID=2496865 RepID=UPI0029393FF7|nr:MBOAT family O-acyltransferase [Maribacter sp. MJ134]
MFRFIGYDMQNQWTLKIILPVGISFYTFQTMSYTIDVYRKDLKPTRDFISFASFVSFFPQLVAGPIERATNLLPQILEQRIFNKNQVVSGLRLITWGLFKKVVIADSLSPLVNTIFENYNTSSGVTLWLGAIYFSFQIYCDFSGYSDIAIGTSKLFGFELMSNFKFPYFSRNIGEFWRKWHISLSTWFRDYLYIPLGGSKGNKLIAFKNIFVIFIVSGFWHGANWTFLFWGLLHALFYIPSFIFKKNRKFIGTVSGGNKNLPTIKELFQMLSTFLFVMLGWVFFRSETIVKAFDYLKRMFFDFSFDFGLTQGLYYVLVLICLDWIIRKDERNIYPISSNIVYISILIWAIILYSFDNEQAQFIYFQF